MTYPATRWRDRLTTVRAARAARSARQDLARELGAYTSRADLLDLAAICARYSDADADPIRDQIDWTRAA